MKTHFIVPNTPFLACVNRRADEVGWPVVRDGGKVTCKLCLRSLAWKTRVTSADGYTNPLKPSGHGWFNHAVAGFNRADAVNAGANHRKTTGRSADNG